MVPSSWGSGSWGAAGLPAASCGCSQQLRAHRRPLMQPHQPPAPPGACLTAPLRMQAWAQSPQVLPHRALPADTRERGPHVRKVSAGRVVSSTGACVTGTSRSLCHVVVPAAARLCDQRCRPQSPCSPAHSRRVCTRVHGARLDAASDNFRLQPPCEAGVRTGRWVVPQTDSSRGAQKRRVWASSHPLPTQTHAS